VPLIERLSNGQFIQELDILTKLANALRLDASPAKEAKQLQQYACGCGEQVTGSRKFVSQDHYSVWLSRERFFGKNKRG
jgi:hypothetical protein